MVRLDRTLGEITSVSVTPAGRMVELLIPGWASHVTKSVPFIDLPIEIQERLYKEVPLLVLVKVDLSTDDVDFLNPMDFELAPEVLVDTTLSNFLGSSRHIDLTGLVEYQDSHGLMITHVGAFSLWENGGVVLNHDNRTEDVLPAQVKSVVGCGTHEYKPVFITWVPEEQFFSVAKET